MFAFLALAGDVGCSVGPTLTGFAADLLGGSISSGILISIVFPVFMFISLQIMRKNEGHEIH